MHILFVRTSVLVGMAALIYGIDRLTAFFYGEQTLAPVLAILCFGGLIFLDSPRLILLAIPLFAGESYWIIQDVARYPHIRTLSVCLGGLLAYWACLQRQNLDARRAELEFVLATLKVPWILCDCSGNIRQSSYSAAQITGAEPPDLQGISFFSKFTAGASKGELIQKFLKTADSRLPVNKLTLSAPENPGAFFEASFVPIETQEGAGILVILASTETST